MFSVFSDECIAAQSFVFLVAGSDTTAGALSFIMYAIAKHPEIQKQVQEEIDQSISSKGWSYEAIKELTYMDQVIQGMTIILLSHDRINLLVPQSFERSDIR
jgi:cytochrome P450